MFNEKWDLRFLELSKNISTWSKDPSTKVGTIIVDQDRRIISTGYNGFPQKIEDKEDLYNNRELKYEMILHAEENAIIFSNQKLNDCIIYTYPLSPCSKCTSKIIQSGITEVVSVFSADPRWKKSLELSSHMLFEADISFRVYKDEKLYYWNKK